MNPFHAKTYTWAGLPASFVHNAPVKSNHPVRGAISKIPGPGFAGDLEDACLTASHVCQAADCFNSSRVPDSCSKSQPAQLSPTCRHPLHARYGSIIASMNALRYWFWISGWSKSRAANFRAISFIFLGFLLRLRIRRFGCNAGRSAAMGFAMLNPSSVSTAPRTAKTATGTDC